MPSGSRKLDEHGLNPMQRLFCDHLLADKKSNGTKAAIKAGYSKKTAEVQASTLLRHPKVSAYLAMRRKKVGDKLEITAERWVREVACIAYSRFDDYYDIDNTGVVTVKPIGEMSEEAIRAIRGVKDIRKIKESKDGSSLILEARVEHLLHDKLKGLEFLGKYLGTLKEKIDIEGQLTISGLDISFVKPDGDEQETQS